MKFISIKNEQQKQGIALADLVDDKKVDCDKWVSFDGKPLTDDVKEVTSMLLENTWKIKNKKISMSRQELLDYLLKEIEKCRFDIVDVGFFSSSRSS
ncbi:hypothetical protein ABKP85_03140 [Lactococcus cremoris]|nr:hypothetical protein [Lactococcus cremoris]